MGFKEKEYEVKHADVEVFGYGVLAIDHFPLPYIAKGHHIDGILHPTELNKMPQITFRPFGHTLIPQRYNLFKITVLIGMDYELAFLPGVAQRVERLVTADQ